MKKLLSLFLCIPLFFISLFITTAEEIENNVEVILKNETGNEISVTTLKTDISQEKLYRDTIGVILNERERLGEIYKGFSLQLPYDVSEVFQRPVSINPSALRMHFVCMGWCVVRQQTGNHCLFWRCIHDSNRGLSLTIPWRPIGKDASTKNLVWL